MTRWHKKIAGISLISIGTAVAIGMSETMMLYPQTGLGQTLLGIAGGVCVAIIGVVLRHASREPRKTYYLGSPLSRYNR